PARSPGPLPEDCDQRCPGRPTNQRRKSRARKIKGIRQALLPVTYILPSAALGRTAAARLRGKRARRPTPPTRRNGGETPPELGARALLPKGGRERLRPARRPRRQGRGPSPTAAAPSRLPPRGAQPLPGAGGGGKFPPEGARRAALPLCRSDRLREEGREKRGGRQPP
ncbi:unnamed protein product, partial [Bubo scandiacus]